MNDRQIKNGTRVWAAACVAFIVFGCSKKGSSSAEHAASDIAQAVTINVADVGGGLVLLQDAIERYRAQHPTIVEKFTFTKAPAPELPGKLKAMQAAGRSDIDLVLGGTDILAAGIDQGLWIRILPDHADTFPGTLDRYQPRARDMQSLAQGNALAVVFMPSGPLLEYNPAKVDKAPRTPGELLAWCKANPKRFIYARPRTPAPAARS